MLFFSLILGETIFGDKRTREIVQVVDVPVSLRAPVEGTNAMGSWYVRLDLPFDSSTSFSCPRLVSEPFPTLFEGRDGRNLDTDLKTVTLPLSPPISGVEVGKIIAVFRKEISFEGFATR